MDVVTEPRSPWAETTERRVIREYDTLAAALDDVWEAHQHGWLPISMNKEERPVSRSLFPLRWPSKQPVVYVVAYRHTAR
jgi:hypothetical protein